MNEQLQDRDPALGIAQSLDGRLKLRIACRKTSSIRITNLRNRQFNGLFH